MRTITSTFRLDIRRIRRHLLTLTAVSLASVLAFVGPAAAAPGGQQIEVVDLVPEAIEEVPDLDIPAVEPIGTLVLLSAAFECDPESGISYDGQILNGPEKRPNIPNVELLNITEGGVSMIPGLSGSMPGPDGTTYELQAHVYYPPLPLANGQLPAMTLTSNVVSVTIDCADPDDEDADDEDEDDDDEEDADEDDDTEVKGDIVEATPTFTG